MILLNSLVRYWEERTTDVKPYLHFYKAFGAWFSFEAYSRQFDTEADLRFQLDMERDDIMYFFHDDYVRGTCLPVDGLNGDYSNFVVKVLDEYRHLKNRRPWT